MASAKLTASGKKKPSLVKGSKLASIKKIIMGATKKVKKQEIKSSKKESLSQTTRFSNKAKPKEVHQTQSSKVEQIKIYKVQKPVSIKQTAIKKSARNGVRLSSEAMCREIACEGLSTTGGYCRLHYIKNWKKIKRKELILREKKLNQYIEELVSKYPDKYIEAIKSDLATDKEFSKVIHDLDLDESVEEFEAEGESPESMIEHIKRDFEDEGDGF